MSRYGLDFEHIGFRGVTFEADDSLKNAVLAARGWENDGRSAVLDKAVALTGDGKVGFGADGDRLFGRVHQYEFDGYVTVQDSGYCTLPANETAMPAPGDWVVVDGTGKVKVSENAGTPVPTNAIVVSADSVNKTVVVRIS
jgi:hypothetical protein